MTERTRIGPGSWRWKLVQHAPQLTATERHIALTIGVHMNSHGTGATVGIRALAAETARNTHTVTAAIARLNDLGWLDCNPPLGEPSGTRARTYSATVPAHLAGLDIPDSVASTGDTDDDAASPLQATQDLGSVAPTGDTDTPSDTVSVASTGHTGSELAWPPETLSVASPANSVASTGHEPAVPAVPAAASRARAREDPAAAAHHHDAQQITADLARHHRTTLDRRVTNAITASLDRGLTPDQLRWHPTLIAPIIAAGNDSAVLAARITDLHPDHATSPPPPDYAQLHDRLRDLVPDPATRARHTSDAEAALLHELGALTAPSREAVLERAIEIAQRDDDRVPF